MNVVDLLRVRRTLSALDRLVAAYPELRGEGARATVFLDTAAELHDQEADLDRPANDTEETDEQL